MRNSSATFQTSGEYLKAQREAIRNQSHPEVLVRRNQVSWLTLLSNLANPRLFHFKHLQDEILRNCFGIGIDLGSQSSRSSFSGGKAI